MRLLGIFICGVLLSVQGFAIKGGTGKNVTRTLKEMLLNQSLIAKVAALNGESSVAINSRNLGAKVFSAAVGVGMLFAVATADANVEGKAKEVEKKIGSAKVIDVGDEMKLDVGGRIFGSFADYDDSKADVLNGGIGVNATLSRHLTSLTLSAKLLSNNTKAAGADEYTGAEDYIGRADFTQGIPIRADSVITPLLYAEAGAAQYGENKRQSDAIVGVGLGTSHELFGKNMELQVRGGLGGLWEGSYDGSDYADLDGETVASFGAILKTGWVSLGTFLDADEGSVLDYVPIIPGAVTTYTQYHPIGNGDSGATRRLESNISIVKGLGVTVEWNKRSGEQASKAILATVSFDIF